MRFRELFNKGRLYAKRDPKIEARLLTPYAEYLLLTAAVIVLNILAVVVFSHCQGW